MNILLFNDRCIHNSQEGRDQNSNVWRRYNPIKMGTNDKVCHYKIYYNKAKMLFTGTLISNALPT